jgi:hypothetical protein
LQEYDCFPKADAAAVPIKEIEQKLDLLRRAMNEFADSLPSHEEALRKYCAFH